MLSCKVLSIFYGRDTRPVQWVNVILCTVWVVVMLSVHLNLIPINIPKPIQQEFEALFILASATISFAVIGFTTVKRTHQVIKTFALLCGALMWAVIANGYVSAYPPLDIMLFVSTALSLWFFFAVFYIVKCEGLNGTFTRKR